MVNALRLEHWTMRGHAEDGDARTTRAEARPDSEVDLFFDHPEGSLGLYELMDVKEATARILGQKADIMTRRSLHRVLRENIKASAQFVF